jgi:hypothetical protein
MSDATSHHVPPDVQAQVDAVWEEFWAPLVMPKGRPRIAQIRRELYDYYRVMGECLRLAEVCGERVDGDVATLAALVDRVAAIKARADEFEVLEAKMRAVEASADALLAAGRLTRKGYRELLDQEPAVSVRRAG